MDDAKPSISGPDGCETSARRSSGARRWPRWSREAIARLPAGPLEIVVSEADAAVLDREWLGGVFGPGAVETPLVVTGAIDGGCVVRLRDGRASFDNTYAARAERLQSVWRAALADVYERATSNISRRAAPPRRDAMMTAETPAGRVHAISGSVVTIDAHARRHAR